MEERQREIVRKNKPELIRLLSCNTTLLAGLESKNVLSQEDVQELKSPGTPIEKNDRLLEILLTKSEGFEVFKDILKATSQSGAVQLLHEMEVNLEESEKNIYRRRPVELELFREQTNLILLSYNPHRTIQRIMETVDHFKFTESQDLRLEKDAFEAVIEGDCPGYFACYENRWLVISSVRKKRFFNPSSSWLVKEELIRWKDLTRTGRELVLSSPLKFHCFTRTLDEFCQIICTICDETKKSDILDNLETELLDELLVNSTPQIALQNIPKISKRHYIDRKLLTRHRISRKIINDTKYSENCDVFLFHCKKSKLKLYELQAFVERHGDGRCDRSSNQIKQRELSVSSVLLEDENHFDEMCVRARGKPVHFLSCVLDPTTKEITELRWIKSHGTLNALQKYIHQTQDEISECEIDKIKSEGAKCLFPESTRPILIADSPGMGKSWLICHCAGKVLGAQEKLDSISLILTFYLPHFMEKMRGVLKNLGRPDHKITQDVVVDVLAQGCSNFGLGKSLVKSLFEATKESIKKLNIQNIWFEFLFDGLDELANGLLELGIKVLQMIGREIHFPVFVRAWIPVRPQHLENLETRLEVLGYNIQALTESDQINIIVNYWKDEEVEAKLSGSYQDRATFTAKACLEKLKTKLELDDCEKLTGLPLLCVYFGRATKNHANHVLQEDLESERRLPDLTINEIYQLYVDEHFPNSANVQTDPAYLRHLEKSLETVFPETSFKGVMKIETEKLDDDFLLQFGILEKSNKHAEVSFRHITLAEYLAAQSIVRVLKLLESFSDSTILDVVDRELYGNLIRLAFSVDEKQDRLSCAFKLEQIKSFGFRYLNICYFLNFSLTQVFDMGKIVDILYPFIEKDDRLELGNRIWRRLEAAIRANFSEIVVHLILTLQHVLKDIFNDFFERFPYQINDLIFLSAKYGNMKLLENVLEFCRNLDSVPEKMFHITHGGITPVHVACESGNWIAVSHFINHIDFSKFNNDLLCKNLIAHCLRNSSSDRKPVIKRKEELLDILAHKYPAIFEHKHSYNIVLERIHVQLLVKYLLVRAKIDRNEIEPVVNRYGENVLHLLANGHYDENISAEDYHNIIKAVGAAHGSRFISKHLKQTNNFGWRAVDVAISSLDLLDKTLDYFDQLKIRFNENNLLAKAVASQRNQKLLERVIQRGALIELNILHVAAAKYNYSAVKYFVERWNHDVNATDSYGNTPLHMCFLEEAENIGMSIDDANFNSYMENFSKLRKPSASYSGSLDKHLRRRDSSVSENLNQSFSERSSLETEPNNQHKIISFLIERNANIDSCNKGGITPLDLAIDVCLGGLQGKEEKILRAAKTKLFENPKYLTLALKGLLLNPILGYLWHPSLIFSFARAIIKAGGDVKVTEHAAEKVPLLHMAAKSHSYFGVKFLVEIENFSKDTVDGKERDAIEYMKCESNCKKYNCTKIKDYLSE